MSSLKHGFRCLRDFRARTTATQQPRSSAYITPTINPKTRRQFTTTTCRRDRQLGELRQAIERDPESSEALIPYVRPLPLSPSYFSRHIEFNDSFVVVQDLARKYGRLPTLPPGKAERVAWKTKEQYRLLVGEAVKTRDYASCIALVKRLHQIHPDLMPAEVLEGIRPFKRDINIYLNTAKPIPVDKFGRSHGVGRRKSSTARAWLVEGTGEVLINGKTLKDAFGRVYDRESALWGLKTMDRMDKYNVWALVEGGGTTGQAEALAMAVAKALAVHEPGLKTPLRKAGCLTRDPRKVERKKPGHLKARKMPAWVKR
ncbi:37S ribosomal protein S9 [Hypoxylon sp. NC1633]|nr:37S ribosomal protein S9 [Hypoxylon sp. NC1633]